MNAPIHSFNLHGYRLADGRWAMSLQVAGKAIMHQRVAQTYASPGDVATSARHLLNELTKTPAPAPSALAVAKKKGAKV